MSKQWVQHISGQGKKYLRIMSGDTTLGWCVANSTHEFRLHLPLDEYVLCEPPASDEWMDVTATCDTDTDYSLLDHPAEGGHGWRIFAPAGLYIGQYRLRKIEINQHNYADIQSAFIVERKEPL